VPKSVSALTSTPPVVPGGLKDGPITRRSEPERCDMRNVPPLLGRHVDEARGQVVVDQQPHADGRNGSWRSRTVSAA
jgi:hypothetical protein